LRDLKKLLSKNTEQNQVSQIKRVFIEQITRLIDLKELVILFNTSYTLYINLLLDFGVKSGSIPLESRKA